MAALAAAMLLMTACGGLRAENAAPSSAETTEEITEAAAGKTSAPEENGEEPARTDQGASAGEMTTVEDVVEDWMVPIAADRLKEGTYPVAVDSSSSMFKIASSELTVAGGSMTAVLNINSTSYLYLYMGTAEEAAAAPGAP